ncbi:BTB/POZ domain-containing protein [Vigna angularis]|uniref:BTB/POZ domain-containing protein n=1 Tax=Phaseolus angularis TaxID=3914 RepID=A0A8T0KJR1_PHAAN|nr:BTB/POZ domain-containing protein [Vigna angularis]
MAAKFCYDIKINLSPSNVAALRCVGEFLEMTEDYSKDNLVSKIKRFLSQHVLKSLKDSVKTLKSCDSLMPMSETLGITQMTVDYVVLWNGIDGAGRRKAGAGHDDSWFEDLADTLEKKIGLKLEEATLNDLLIPSYSYLNKTLYDVVCMESILSYFLESLEARNVASNEDPEAARLPMLMLVGKLINGYLSEIDSDANLKPEKRRKKIIEEWKILGNDA